MRFATTMLCVVCLVACSETTKPNALVSDPTIAALVEPGRAYVLGQVEDQRTEPIVTFDHACAGGHYTHTIRDTIEFLPGGAVRRAFVLEFGTNGSVRDRSYMTARGSWDASGGTLTLGLAPVNYSGPPYVMTVYARGTDAIISKSGLGGSCPGSPNDGRQADFIYTRR